MTDAASVLLVEGPDDEYAVDKLLRKHALNPSFEIRSKGGYTQLRQSIRPEINVSGRTAVGIIADANRYPSRRWDSLRKALADAYCTIPAKPPLAGAVVTGPRNIRVGVWLMPDNQHAGQLEDFIAHLIPRTDVLWPIAQKFIDDIPPDLRQFPLHKRTRARVHAWLATRETPRPMGSAITAGDLDHNAPIARSLVEWLCQLFSLQTHVPSLPDEDT